MTYTESMLDPTPEFINACQMAPNFLRWRHLTVRQGIAEFRGEPYPETYTSWLGPELANPYRHVDGAHIVVDSPSQSGY